MVIVLVVFVVAVIVIVDVVIAVVVDFLIWREERKIYHQSYNINAMSQLQRSFENIFFRGVNHFNI